MNKRLTHPILLASQSPRRKQLLEQLGIPFTVQASAADESIGDCPPEEMVGELAARKARDVAAMVGGPAWVLGVDTVVVHREEVFGKPRDREDARRMLEALRGGDHQVYTGLCLYNVENGESLAHVECSRVFVDEMTAGEVEAYIDSGEPMDKAGAYGIQGRFAAYINRVEGCYYAVMGLPLSALRKVLAEAERRWGT